MSSGRIGINSWGSMSPLGSDPATIWQAYQRPETCVGLSKILNAPVAELQEVEEQLLRQLKAQDKNYKALDKSVLMALFAAEQAVSNRTSSADQLAVNLGSSRGATGLFEKYFGAFAENPDRKLSPLSSPSTTSGNLSTWVAYHLGLQGATFSHSVTCSTALHAVLNGIAWLRSGLCQAFLAGGSEAPLTPFTIAQMKAMRIYSNRQESPFPNLSLAKEKQQNTMVLGEGAACFYLKINPLKPLAYIDGIGFGQEKIRHATAISENGNGFQKAMEMALKSAGLKKVDAVICHAPGTQKGDLAELKAIEKSFNKNIPRLTSNKWKIGHTLGASGALSLELALLMLENNEFIGIPYLEQSAADQADIKSVMVNAAGFGGNVVSLILRKP